MTKFNDGASLSQNIKGGLWVNNKTIDDMAAELDIPKQNIIVAISRKFKRNGNISPQNRKMIAYLLKHCSGFSRWAKENEIQIDS